MDFGLQHQITELNYRVDGVAHLVVDWAAPHLIDAIFFVKFLQILQGGQVMEVYESLNTVIRVDLGYTDVQK